MVKVILFSFPRYCMPCTLDQLCSYDTQPFPINLLTSDQAGLVNLWVVMQSKKNVFFLYLFFLNKKKMFFFIIIIYDLKAGKCFLILWSAYSCYIKVVKHYIQYINCIFIDSETNYLMNYNTNLHSNIKLHNFNTSLRQSWQSDRLQSQTSRVQIPVLDSNSQNRNQFSTTSGQGWLGPKLCTGKWVKKIVSCGRVLNLAVEQPQLFQKLSKNKK